jgi:hypothetical protein
MGRRAADPVVFAHVVGQHRSVTADFERWLSQVTPRDDLDPGLRPAGADRLLREIFERRGPISFEELHAEGREIEMDLARHAVRLVQHDLHATGRARPNITTSHDDEYSLIVMYNGGWTTPAMTSMQHPQSTCEIADYVQGEIVEDIGAAWPTCPSHRSGLHAETDGAEAIWYCRTGKHRVAAIGQLTL